jgi:hypothetical protein
MQGYALQPSQCAPDDPFSDNGGGQKCSDQLAFATLTVALHPRRPASSVQCDRYRCYVSTSTIARPQAFMSKLNGLNLISYNRHPRYETNQPSASAHHKHSITVAGITFHLVLGAVQALQWDA